MSDAKADDLDELRHRFPPEIRSPRHTQLRFFSDSAGAAKSRSRSTPKNTDQRRRSSHPNRPPAMDALSIQRTTESANVYIIIIKPIPLPGPPLHGGSLRKMGSENSHSPENVQPRPGFGLAGQIVALVLAIIFIFLVFLSCLYCWARCLRRSNSPDPSARRRRLGLRGDRDSARLRRLGLEKSVIESLPVFVYQSAKHDNGLECAVCLCEFEDEEEARLLPNCKHGFHVECIDTWFDSHSTCPLCRSAVIPDAPSTVAVDGGPSSGAGPEIDEEAWPSEEQRRAAGMASETQPDDVLSCRAQNLDGTGSRFGSSGLDGESSTPKGLGKIVIDDPGRADGFPSQRFCTGDAQQCYSPADRLRSLKRILSRDKKDLPQSPCGLDLEQQARRAQT